MKSYQIRDLAEILKSKEGPLDVLRDLLEGICTRFPADPEEASSAYVRVSCPWEESGSVCVSVYVSVTVSVAVSVSVSVSVMCRSSLKNNEELFMRTVKIFATNYPLFLILIRYLFSKKGGGIRFLRYVLLIFIKNLQHYCTYIIHFILFCKN